MPYRTEWVEYPDLKPKFESLGIPPNDINVNPLYEYSSPAARFPDGTSVMDSLKIARKLEQVQTEPSLHLDNGYVEKTQNAVTALWDALRPLATVRVAEKLLNPPSAAYFSRTRAARSGMPLAELAKSDQAKNTWRNAEEPLNLIKNILYENEDGPYVMGTEASFADLVLAGFWKFVQKLDDSGDLTGKILGFDPSLERHYQACKEWLQRDDH